MNASKLIVYHLAQFFTSLKEGDLLGGYMHALSCLGVSTIPRVALPYAKTAEPTQIHFIPLCQSVGDARKERIHD